MQQSYSARLLTTTFSEIANQSNLLNRTNYKGDRAYYSDIAILRTSKIRYKFYLVLRTTKNMNFVMFNLLSFYEERRVNGLQPLRQPM